ncbi:hypothetical protein WISP_76499 [Willisornis vidua]|uniref:Uncharacterized protein n=1 Tax=Willisornis vidua TaxID=1566151 RepID=A0ABQ9D775_9PASS|nr:hypothetical protein WISP_76499 [Willisornis vidua]
MFPLLSILIMGTVWWSYMWKRHNERQSFMSWLTLPLWQDLKKATTHLLSPNGQTQNFNSRERVEFPMKGHYILMSMNATNGMNEW